MITRDVINQQPDVWSQHNVAGPLANVDSETPVPG